MRDYAYSVRLYRPDGSETPIAVNHPETINPVIKHGLDSGEYVRAVVKKRVPGGWVRLMEVSREQG